MPCSPELEFFVDLACQITNNASLIIGKIIAIIISAVIYWKQNKIQNTLNEISATYIIRTAVISLKVIFSEGFRPRLPWAKKLEQFLDDPMPILPILENLKEDESMFVKKSVANNLNDILKDNYSIGIKILKKWSKTKNKDTQWIIKHALRNELKKGNPEAKKLVIKTK